VERGSKSYTVLVVSYEGTLTLEALIQTSDVDRTEAAQPRALFQVLPSSLRPGPVMPLMVPVGVQTAGLKRDFPSPALRARIVRHHRFGAGFRYGRIPTSRRLTTAGTV